MVMVEKRKQLRLIEDELIRQLSFAKRQNGLIKKALELHMLCDVDAVFIAFSPSGRLSYFCGDSRANDVISRFVAFPEHTQQFHIPDLELQLLLEILNQLRDQTKEHIKSGRTISAIQKELFQVKEEIQCVLSEIKTRRNEPLQEAIMTIEEANLSEEILEETLASVQERKKGLTANHNEDALSQPSYSMNEAENSSPKPLDEVQQDKPEHQPNEDALSQPSYSMNEAENSSPKPLDEVQQDEPEHQPNEDALSQPSYSMNEAENSSPKPFDEVQQDEPEHQPNESSDENQQQSPAAEGIQATLMNQSSPSTNPLLEGASPLPQHAGTSFTGLLTAADVAETFSPLRETVFLQSAEQNNSYSSLQQNQFDFCQVGLLDAYSYLNVNLTGVDQSSECNEINTSGTANGYNYPVPFLMSPNFQLPSSPASFQVPHHQMQFPVQAPNYYQISQMPLGSSDNVSLFSTPQWSNQRTLQQNLTPFVQNPQWCYQRTLQQNPIPLGQNSIQRASFLNLLSSVSGLNDMYPDSRSPNLQMNHQSMGGRNNTEPSISLNLQGPFANNSPQAHLEVEGSPSSAHKRKLPWEDDIALRLSSYQNGNTASNNTLPATPSPCLRPPRFGVYNPAYEQVGLPVDPHIRIFQEILENDDGKRQRENQ